MTAALPRRATDDTEASFVEKREASYGQMGLTGLWALVGNSTGMLIVSVVLFMAIFQVERMHNEAMITFKEMSMQERESNRSINEQTRSVVEQNTKAIRALTDEIRKTK